MDQNGFYASQSEYILTFGLGKVTVTLGEAQRVDVVVQWPASRRRIQYNNVDANTVLLAWEDDACTALACGVSCGEWCTASVPGSACCVKAECSSCRPEPARPTYTLPALVCTLAAADPTAGHLPLCKAVAHSQCCSKPVSSW